MMMGIAVLFAVGVTPRTAWVSVTDTHVEAREVLAMPGGLYLSAHCAVRDFAIDGISALEIAQELATAELGWLAQQYADRQPIAIGKREADRLLADLKTWHQSGAWGRGPGG